MYQPSNFRPTHFNATIFNSEMAAYLQSDTFRQHIAEVSQDDYARARLTVALLDHVALNPLGGSRVEDFVSVAPDDSYAEVYLSLYQLSNFIGGFTIHRGSPEWSMLKQAIRKNLNSKMFKAAAMHVRMREQFPRRIRAVGDRAQAAFKKALDEALHLRHPQPATGWTRPSPEALDASYALAHQAKQAVYLPYRDRLEHRMEAVRLQSAHPDYRGSFFEIQTAFAAQYLVPASTEGRDTFQ